jgi:hypothetical protein
MPNDKQTRKATGRVLVKLRPTGALRAAESRANLRPLYETHAAPDARFGLDSEPRWFVADLADGAENPWDAAHARLGAQLGVSDSDVLFAEPDMVRPDAFPDTNETGAARGGFAAGEQCANTPQDGRHGKRKGPDGVFAWHLGDDYTQLASARAAVTFTDPRTRVAHIDTGYYRSHDTVPERVLRRLERSFVEGDADAASAEDPDNRRLLLDNSGHGTGTLGILAGGRTPADFGGDYLGGAPQAEVLPLRVSDSVVLVRTSALARALSYAVEQRCDVVTMSMGGVPSEAWAEAVDAAYEAGTVLCAAAGNNVGIGPPRVLVYPARYPRAIAVCGVMADGAPYTGLDRGTLQGSFGPESVMARSAIAAYTPNIPWPLFMCGTFIRLNGEGTSAATPQVAAAAALWIERYKNELPRDWRRVEAVRHALFQSAKMKQNREHFGNGVLQARAALDVRPAFGLPKRDRSDNSWAVWRMTTGLGVAERPPRERMFNLELAQRWLLNEELQKLLPDPEAIRELSAGEQRELMEAVIEDTDASLALRRHVASRYPAAAGRSAPRTERSRAVVPEDQPVCRSQPELRNPPFRRLRVYATDPSFSTRLETASTNEVTLKVRWEELGPGPVGEYLAVAETDADGNPKLDGTREQRPLAPVDLNDPRLLAQDGWAPSEGNPQFHQQMVYAVAMKTVEHFESALGRPVLWRPRPNPASKFDDSQYVRRLDVRPHALRQANAFYSPERVALLFGYFEASATDPGRHMPGTRVYSCLSHDIIAHETTHAILDGMHRRFNEPTNPDVLALHEAFADIVALMQHFTIPEVLESEIARTRGDIETESSLGSLAVQFGYAMGGRGALRDAIGRIDDAGRWTRLRPDPTELERRLTPHARGAILVAAVFDAFIAIYKSRTADLLRIYTGGTGVLPSGAIHPDLVRRLADAAAKSARHVLNMCIRALDYLPPVDVTFGEYLRGLITADFDFVADDQYDYRVAFVESFRARGIYPNGLDTLSVDTLRWDGLDHSGLSPKMQQQYDAIVGRLKRYADACIYIDDREKLFGVTRSQRAALHRELKAAFAKAPAFAAGLGIANTGGRGPKVEEFEVHALRRSLRTGPGGRQVPQVVVALTQCRQIKVGGREHTFRGGSTLVVDLLAPAVKYRIHKDINSKLNAPEGPSRLDRTIAFYREVQADPLRGLLFATDREEPFAALHALADDGF